MPTLPLLSRATLAVALATLTAAPLAAQGPSPSAAHASDQGEPISLDGKIDVDGGKHFKGMTKIIVPTVLVRLATRGSLTVVNQGRFFESDNRTAKAKGKFVVAGLDKAYVQSLAKQVQDDLVARLRTAGYTVLTYDDIKDNADVAGMKRYKPDADYGMPTGGPTGSKNTYLMAFPSDAQAIDPPLQGYGWGFRKVAKEMDAAVMVPELVVDAPLLTGSKKHGISSRGASVSVFPEMVVTGSAPFWTAKGAWGSIRLKSAIGDVVDSVGVIGDASDDSPKFANAIASGLSQLGSLGADLQSKSGTWGLKVDKTAYSAGVLRSAMAFNMAVGKTATAEKAK